MQIDWGTGPLGLCGADTGDAIPDAVLCCAVQSRPVVHPTPFRWPSCHPCAGPPPLMTAVHLAVARLNDSACNSGKEGAYLELHKEAVEL